MKRVSLGGHFGGVENTSTRTHEEVDPRCLPRKRRTKSSSATLRSQNWLCVLAACIKVEMCSHLTNGVPVQSHNSFRDQRPGKSHCVISQEPFLYSVITVSELSTV